jgi:hypothetical protein
MKRRRGDEIANQRHNMSPEQKNAQREKRQDKRQNMSPEQIHAQNEQNRMRMMICHGDEIADQKDAQKEQVKLRMKRLREEENTEETASQKTKATSSNRRKRQCRQQTTVNNVYNDKKNKFSIVRLMKKAKYVLQRTKDPDNPFRFREIVCIICDCFIIGTEKIQKLKPDQISKRSHQLSVTTYESYYGQELKPELSKQYQVNCDGLQDLLLSP